MMMSVLRLGLGGASGRIAVFGNFLLRFAEIPWPSRLGGFALRGPVITRFPGATLLLVTGIPGATLLPRIPRPVRGALRAIMKLPQGAAQRFDLAFVREFLALGQFHQFQHFLHLIGGVLERFDNVHDFVNRLVDGGNAMLQIGPAGRPLRETLHPFQQRSHRLRRAARWNGIRRWLWGGRGAERFAAFGGFGHRRPCGGCLWRRDCNVCPRSLWLARSRGKWFAPPAPATSPAPPTRAPGRGFCARSFGAA